MIAASSKLVLTVLALASARCAVAADAEQARAELLAAPEEAFTQKDAAYRACMKVLDRFASSQSDDRNSPHTYANKHPT